MERYRFIFSDSRKYRFARHLVFWGSWWLFCGFLYAFMPYSLNIGYGKGLLISLTDAFIFLPSHIFFAYSLMYFVIPWFMVKNKYLMTALWVFLLCIITATIAALITNYVLTLGRKFLLDAGLRLNIRPKDSSFYYSLLAGLRGGITIGGLAAAIKIMKYYYLKEQRNIQLQKENLESQLQLLKAQVHPHFLFNTLNNIYSYTQHGSPVASNMLTRLSDILRYILYEGNHPIVPLSKELKMLKDYISLEQVRYGNKLDVHFDLPEKTDDLYIAPLLLLPLVENCFKHGTSHMLDQPWISLHIHIEETMMSMKLLNGKLHGLKVDPQPGIGLQNVKKRLNLLYPDKYDFLISAEEEVFIVNLKIKLDQIKTVIQNSTAVQQLPVHA
ncbi:MAG: sensor histidine kinase [Chitinophagaceae bacterium]